MPSIGASLGAIFGQLGQVLATQLLASLKGHPNLASSVAGSKPVRRGPGRPSVSGAEAQCLVPACDRRAVAKKLCASHYRKAAHLEVHAPFSAKELDLLARDGRAMGRQVAAVKHLAGIKDFPRHAASLKARCRVLACDRPAAAKNLCKTHYNKAARLKMGAPFSPKQLALLARDGRAMRWENVPARGSAKRTSQTTKRK